MIISNFIHFPADDEPLPSADGDFVFNGTAIPSAWTLTRESAALGRGADGRWTFYVANVPRPHHHPVTLASLGLLLEPTRTQLIYSSRPLVLTTKSATRTEDATVQTPFGMGCTKLADNTTNASHGMYLSFGVANNAAALPDGATVSLQLTFKPFGGLTRGQIIATTKSGAALSVEFSTAGTAPSIVSHSMISASIEPDTDGFFRLECSVNVGSGTTTAAANIYFMLDDGTRVYSGDGTKGFLIAHYGAEIGDECTSPIITTGASVTRSEDVLSTQGAWLQVGPKSLAIQYTPLAAASQVVLHASGTDSIEFRNDAQSANVRTAHYSLTAGGVNVGSLTGAAPTAGVERTNVLTAAYNLFWLAQDGQKLAFDETGQIPNAINSIRIGGRVVGGFVGPMLLRRVKYWREALDREAAAAFSADIAAEGIIPVLPVVDVQASQTIPATASSIALTVTLSGEPSGATFSYRTLNGTAMSGVDYTATTGTLTFQPGVSITTIPISLLTRSLIETRSFSVELFAVTGATLGTAACVITLTKAAPTAHAPLKYVTFDGPLSSDWFLSRATAGYARDSAGVWRSVPAEQPRIHFTATGTSGILLEPASEQRLFDSIANFYLANSTQTTDTTTPVPTGNRSLIWRETAVTGTHTLRAFWSNTVVDWPTGDLTFSAIVKPVGARTRYRILLKGIDNIYTDSRFEFTGSGSVTGGTTAAIHRIEQEPMAPGWYRIGVSRTQAASAGVTPEFSFGPLDPDTESPTLAGDVNNGFDLCHAQIEPGMFWTSPIPVQGATAKTVRAADVLKAGGGWQARESFALGVRFLREGAVPATQRIVQFRDVSPAVDDYGIVTASGVVRAPLTTGSVFHGDINGSVNPNGQYSTAIVSIDTTRYSLFVGGTKAGEIAMAGKPLPRTVQHLRFGSREQDGSQGAPIVVHSAAYWTVGLSDEEGAVFSADLSGTPPGEVEPEPLPLINVPATMSVNEGDALQIPVTKIGNGACSVRLVTKAQTASWNVDYTGVDTTVTFASNESTKLVPVQTAADTVTDLNESFGYSVSVIANPPDCQLGNAVGVATIIDPNIAPTSYSRTRGFATDVNCGEGRAWYRVTNLNNSGAGSLRDALSVGNRHVIFEVGGTIALQSNLDCNVDNITVAGETAPAPGIIIQKYEFITRGSNQRFTHLTFEKGHDNSDYGVSNGDTVKCSPGSTATWVRSNIHFDHCLFLWSQDGLFDINPISGTLSNISLTNCIFAEPLWKPQEVGPYRAHEKVESKQQAQHNYSLVVGRGAKTVDVQHCVFQDSDMRHPFIDCQISLVLANNIAHNCRYGATVQYNPNPTEKMLTTCRGYLCISGPQSIAQTGFRFHTYSNPMFVGTRVCVSDLYGWKGGSSSSTYITPETVVRYSSTQPYCVEGGVNVPVETSTPPINIPGYPVAALTADQIYSRAVSNCGPMPKLRSRHALRVADKLSAKAGQWVNHESEVGGRSAFVQTTRALNGATTFADGTTIASPPAATDVAAVKAWINEFRKRVQYDYD